MSKTAHRKMRREELSDEPVAPNRTAVRRELRRLTRAFADELFQALDDFGVFRPATTTTAAPPKPKRLRRSETALHTVTSRLLAALRKRKKPVAISDLAQALDTTKREIAHPLSVLVAEGLVVRTGERRGARYQLVKRPPEASAKRGKSTAPPLPRGKASPRKARRPAKKTR